MKSIPNKSPGDQLFADDWNNVSQELQNAIQDTGITLTGSDLFQLSKTISNYVAYGDYYNDSGAVNNYILNPIASKKAPTVYANGMRIRFMPAVTNTGVSTINVNSLGVKSIVDGNGASLIGGELLAGKFLELSYDGTDFVIIQSSAYPTFRFLTAFKEDLILSNNTTDADHDLDISPGTFVNQDETIAFKSSSTLVKQIDVNWAEGTNDGGFPSGLTLSADTWYHVFALAKADGTVDAGFDTLLAATNLLADSSPSGFIFYRRIGSILTDASSNIKLFNQFNNRFIWNTPEIITPSLTTSYISYVIAVPLGLNSITHLEATISTAAVGDNIQARSTFQTGIGSIIVIADPTEDGTSYTELVSDLNSSIDLKRGNTPAAAIYAIEVMGWTEINF